VDEEKGPKKGKGKERIDDDDDVLLLYTIKNVRAAESER
jgi:hypothetical protein